MIVRVKETFEFWRLYCITKKQVLGSDDLNISKGRILLKASLDSLPLEQFTIPWVKLCVEYLYFEPASWKPEKGGDVRTCDFPISIGLHVKMFKK